MIGRIICVLRGHRWRLCKQGVKVCTRCGVFTQAAF